MLIQTPGFDLVSGNSPLWPPVLQAVGDTQVCSCHLAGSRGLIFCPRHGSRGMTTCRAQMASRQTSVATQCVGWLHLDGYVCLLDSSGYQSLAILDTIAFQMQRKNASVCLITIRPFMANMVKFSQKILLKTSSGIVWENIKSSRCCFGLPRSQSNWEPMGNNLSI